MPGTPFTSVRPEPGASVVLMVDGGKVSSGRFGDKLLLWNKVQAQNLELPLRYGDMLIAMGVGAWETTERGKYLQIAAPCAIRFTRPLEPKTPWAMELVGPAPQTPPSAAPPTPKSFPARPPAPPPGDWDALRHQYRAAMTQALDLVASLDEALVRRALAQGVALKLDLNAITFALFKAAADRRCVIPVLGPPVLDPALRHMPEALQEDDDLPF